MVGYPSFGAQEYLVFFGHTLVSTKEYFLAPFITSKGEFGLISPETDSKRSEYRGVVILRLRTYVSISTPIFANINSVNMPFNLLSMSEP